MVELTARAHECFLRANIEQKRKLLTLIFANFEMQGGNLRYTLRKPFDVLAELPQSENWRALVDRLRTEYYQDVLALSSAVPGIKPQLLAA